VVFVALSGLEGLQEVSSRVINISLLKLQCLCLGMCWVKNDSFFVSLESLNVGLESFNRLILSSVVNSNSNRSGECDTDLGCFEFIKGETSSNSLFLVVPIRGASDSWSKGFSGSWE